MSEHRYISIPESWKGRLSRFPNPLTSPLHHFNIFYLYCLKTHLNCLYSSHFLHNCFKICPYYEIQSSCIPDSSCITTRIQLWLHSSHSSRSSRRYFHPPHQHSQAILSLPTSWSHVLLKQTRPQQKAHMSNVSPDSNTLLTFQLIHSSRLL